MKAECPHTRPGSPVSPEVAAEVTVEDWLVTVPASWLVLNNFDIDAHKIVFAIFEKDPY